MGSSCKIIFDLGFVTLSGITANGTLGGGTLTGTLGGAIVGTSLGTTVLWVFSGCVVLNIFADLSMACDCLSPIVKGVCGPVFLITCISSLSDLVACSVADNPGMTRCCEKNPPHLHFFPPFRWVCSMCSIGGATYMFQCTTPVIHVSPNVYTVEVFRVLSPLFQVVQ